MIFVCRGSAKSAYPSAFGATTGGLPLRFHTPIQQRQILDFRLLLIDNHRGWEFACCGIFFKLVLITDSCCPLFYYLVQGDGVGLATRATALRVWPQTRNTAQKLPPQL